MNEQLDIFAPFCPSWNLGILLGVFHVTNQKVVGKKGPQNHCQGNLKELVLSGSDFWANGKHITHQGLNQFGSFVLLLSIWRVLSHQHSCGLAPHKKKPVPVGWLVIPGCDEVTNRNWFNKDIQHIAPKEGTPPPKKKATSRDFSANKKVWRMICISWFPFIDFRLYHLFATWLLGKTSRPGISRKNYAWASKGSLFIAVSKWYTAILSVGPVGKPSLGASFRISPHRLTPGFSARKRSNEHNRPWS